MDRDLEKYIRVSSILGIFQAYSYVEPAKLKKAIEIGTGIHEAIESYFKQEFQPLVKKQEPYFQSFLQWVDAFHPKPIVCEERFWDDSLMITGKIDLLATIDEEPYLIDFKTGSWAHLEAWELQLTFYRFLIQSHGTFHVPNKFMIVHLQKSGEAPKIYTFDFKEETLQCCFSALRCYEFFKKNLY